MRLPATLCSMTLAATALALATGCEDTVKVSEQKAVDAAAKLVPVVNEDVTQVRRGLPAGAAKLGALVDADPGANLVGLQRAIAGARASVPDLEVAKSTFFSFADTSGVVLRSEADPDFLAQKSVVAVFPELRKALDPEAKDNVELFGEMPEMRGVRNGPDLAWVVAHPVDDPKGTLKGMFVTGWSFRRFAYHLEETAKRDVLEAARKTGRPAPLVYVFALKGNKVYGAPLTPDVDAEALEKLDLMSKTSAGPWRGRVEITDRTYGAAAVRTPDLAPDAGVAVMMSEI
jgi:hypothetical protein